MQVDKNTLGHLAEVYYLIGLAEKYRAQVIDLGSGIQSALSGSQERRQQYQSFLVNTIEKLEPKLKDLVAHSAVARATRISKR